MSEALGLSGVGRAFLQGPKRLEVLRGVDLSIAEGEVAALVAPSGAGKSTLLHVAGLLDTPSEGEVRIAGQSMTGLADAARTAARRDRIGFVYQFHHLLPEFSAEENVAVPCMAAGAPPAEARTRAAALLGRVGLEAVGSSQCF